MPLFYMKVNNHTKDHLHRQLKCGEMKRDVQEDFLRLGDLTLRGTFGGDFNLDILTLGWLSFNHFRHNLFKSTTFPQQHYVYK